MGGRWGREGDAGEGGHAGGQLEHWLLLEQEGQGVGRPVLAKNNYMTQIIESNYLVCCLLLIAYCCIFLFCLFAWSLSRLHQYYSTTDSE